MLNKGFGLGRAMVQRSYQPRHIMKKVGKVWIGRLSLDRRCRRRQRLSVTCQLWQRHSFTVRLFDQLQFLTPLSHRFEEIGIADFRLVEQCFDELCVGHLGRLLLRFVDASA